MPFRNLRLLRKKLMFPLERSGGQKRLPLIASVVLLIAGFLLRSDLRDCFNPGEPVPERRRENIQASAGGLTMRNVTLQACISWAYNVQDFQIAGSLSADRFDIVANAGAPVTISTLRTMLGDAPRRAIQTRVSSRCQGAVIPCSCRGEGRLQTSRCFGGRSRRPTAKRRNDGGEARIYAGVHQHSRRPAAESGDRLRRVSLGDTTSLLISIRISQARNLENSLTWSM
jgi:hypothetical protein